MDSTEKSVVGVVIAALVIVAGVFWAYPAFFQCVGQTCLGGGTGGGGGILPVTQTVYADVVSTNPWWGLSISVSGNILPSVSATGEVVKSCNLPPCWLLGTQVSAQIVVTGPNGYYKSDTWNFKLGEGDHEEYVWTLPQLAVGSYQVAVTENIPGVFGNSVITASTSFVIPLTAPAPFSS